MRPKSQHSLSRRSRYGFYEINYAKQLFSETQCFTGATARLRLVSTLHDLSI